MKAAWINKNQFFADTNVTVYITRFHVSTKAHGWLVFEPLLFKKNI